MLVFPSFLLAPLVVVPAGSCSPEGSLCKKLEVSLEDNQGLGKLAHSTNLLWSTVHPSSEEAAGQLCCLRAFLVLSVSRHKDRRDTSVVHFTDQADKVSFLMGKNR